MSDIDYYEQHAERFCEDTRGVDMTPLYQRFLPRLPRRGHVLDAGCGCGRDARAFVARGFRVTAFDASPTLVKLAEEHLGQPVHQLRFEDIRWQRRFDGIWACASLLHVPEADLDDAMLRLRGSLKSGGMLYASFKYGRGERSSNGRRFTDLNETGLYALVRRVGGLKEVETWRTGDLRAGRGSERWLNTLLRRTEAAWDNS